MMPYFIFSLMVLVGACSGDASDLERMQAVSRADVVQRVSVSGVARGSRVSYIRPGYPGFVSKIHVELGQRVQAGTPLMRIAQTVDQPISQIFPVRAPFSGVVTQILKTEGEYVEANHAGSVLRLDDLSQMWVDVDVPEMDVAKISLAMEAEVGANALPGIIYKGVIRQISLSSKESTDRWDRGKVEFPVQVQIINADENLRPGMSTMVNIVTAKSKNVLTLPHEFVHRDEAGAYVLNAEEKRIPIETGLADEQRVEIRSGVSVGLKARMVDFSQITKPGGRRGGRAR